MRQTDKQTHCLINLKSQHWFASPDTALHPLLLNGSLVDGRQQTAFGILRHAHASLGLLQCCKPVISRAALPQLMRPLQLLTKDPATDVDVVMGERYSAYITS